MAAAAAPVEELTEVPVAVGVADVAGYVEPAALISNGCDCA